MKIFIIGMALISAIPMAYANSDDILNAIIISNSINAASAAAQATPGIVYGSAYRKYRPHFWQSRNTKTMNMIELRRLARHQGVSIYQAELPIQP